METFGGLDVLCNNAGILNEEEWETSVSINMVSSHKRRDWSHVEHTISH